MDFEKEIIRFGDLSEFLQRRRVPISHDDIAKRTRHFGRRYSRPAVTRFLGGTLTPKSLAFRVIRDTLEGWLEITFDFSDSPYAESLGTAAVNERQKKPAIIRKPPKKAPPPKSKEVKSPKIPTFSELIQRYPGDRFDEAGHFFIENTPKIRQFVEEHGIKNDVEPLVFALKLLLHEIIKGANNLVELSKGEYDFIRRLYESYLDRLDVMLEEPRFISYMDLDRKKLGKKRIGLEKELAKLGRAGSIKPLMPWLRTASDILKSNGIKGRRQARFFHSLFVQFDVPDFGKSYEDSDGIGESEEIDRILEWFKPKRKRKGG